MWKTARGQELRDSSLSPAINLRNDLRKTPPSGLNFPSSKWFSQLAENFPFISPCHILCDFHICLTIHAFFLFNHVNSSTCTLSCFLFPFCFFSLGVSTWPFLLERLLTGQVREPVWGLQAAKYLHPIMHVGRNCHGAVEPLDQLLDKLGGGSTDACLPSARTLTWHYCPQN